MKRFKLKDWTDKLRSGDYEQGEQYLNKEGKYCCLGVLCELYIECGGKLDKGVGNPVRYDDVVSTLPVDVITWSGLRGKNGPGLVGDSLSFLNDSGCSFDYIAYILEKERGDYFREI